MRNAFLVSDDDLKSLRNGEPWSIELSGQAVFLHESVLRLLVQRNQQPVVANLNPHLDQEGRSLQCDQPGCVRTTGQPFPTYAARQTHRALIHSIPGEYSDKHQQYPKKPRPYKLKLPQLPPPTSKSSRDMEHLVKKFKPASYNYQAQDAQGICGIGDCPYQSSNLRHLHFHRSIKHGVRGINYNRQKGRRGKVGRPRKARKAAR